MLSGSSNNHLVQFYCNVEVVWVHLARYLAVSALDMRSEERDPAATADAAGAGGLDNDAPEAILVVRLLVAARDDVARLTVGRFSLLLLGGGLAAGFI